jgi:hypothetical protein
VDPKRFAVFDGLNGRPTLLERCTALWANYVEAYDTKGPRIADAKLLGWLGTDADKHRRAWERDRDAGALAAPDPARVAARRAYELERSKGHDLPPFAQWLEDQAAKPERRSTSPPAATEERPERRGAPPEPVYDDTIPLAEVKNILTSITKQRTTTRGEA